ncbi:MAG: YncE family protein [Bacteroidetes bacterium]|nr:YncE family protein [Bacteroidota bacterium]
MKKLFILLTVSLLLASCSRSPVQPSSTVLQNASTVYVLNQGIYGQGNSTLTAYYPDSNKVANDVFKTVNGRGLGDTGNDITIFNGKAYMVINNSDKIEVMDASTAKSVGTIYYNSGTSPYRIAVYPDQNTGFVTDLYTNTVSVVDLLTNSLVPADTIPVGANPYGIAYTSGEVFVANSGYGSGNTVTVIDASTRKVVKTITVGAGPTEVEPDGNGNVWVSCPGSYGDIGKVFVIDASTNSVTDSINAGIGLPSFNGSALAVDPQRDAAYLIADSSIIKLDTKTEQISDANFISGSFYAISVDEATGDIYVADAKDYKSDGEVYIYSPDGQFTNRSFTTGINPGAIAFER